MQPEMLPKGIEKDIVDQCAFGRDYRKTTHVWNDIKSWTTTGSTGNGRCGGNCGKGRMVGGYFSHYKALAMEPSRGPRGVGHTKEKNELPHDLLYEFASHALAELPKKKNKRRRVIVDLCAGFQSWAPVASELDCTYVAIDILGNRNAKLPMVYSVCAPCEP